MKGPFETFIVSKGPFMTSPRTATTRCRCRTVAVSLPVIAPWRRLSLICGLFHNGQNQDKKPRAATSRQLSPITGYSDHERPGESMGTATGTTAVGNGTAGALIVVVIVVLYLGYTAFKRHGFRPRRVETTLSGQQLRQVFRRTVARRGWSIADDGNPMIAHSAALDAVRQRIALSVSETNGRTVGELAAILPGKKTLGDTTKAYSLRWRMNSFIAQVRRLDSTAKVVD
ncbi:hypothetical protein [Amycolatopsis sp. WAC 01416]|uniref:hypothetical protein n=1 Tax=Amycolatopsis sp. WAC 01416 TaxID=2203196 RepID=UPI000F7B2776|nr:hypothetical protein [Amycolatopsis sp. WAC 01416]